MAPTYYLKVTRPGSACSSATDAAICSWIVEIGFLRFGTDEPGLPLALLFGDLLLKTDLDRFVSILEQVKRTTIPRLMRPWCMLPRRRRRWVKS